MFTEHIATVSAVEPCSKQFRLTFVHSLPFLFFRCLCTLHLLNHPACHTHHTATVHPLQFTHNRIRDHFRTRKNLGFAVANDSETHYKSRTWLLHQNKLRFSAIPLLSLLPLWTSLDAQDAATYIQWTVWWANYFYVERLRVVVHIHAEGAEVRVLLCLQWCCKAVDDDYDSVTTVCRRTTPYGIWNLINTICIYRQWCANVREILSEGLY